MPEQLKDYYELLQVPHDADDATIKRAYRKLAFKYHPDTNKDNRYAAEHFQELQEAYTIISSPALRKKYDTERWLNGMTNRVTEQEQASAEWMLKEVISLHNYLSGIDTHRMSQSGIHNYLNTLFSDSRMAMLKAEQDASVNEGIVKLVLQATQGLNYFYLQQLCDKLLELTEQGTTTAELIITTLHKRKQHEKLQRLKPVFVIIVTLLLVFAMYLWGGLF